MMKMSKKYLAVTALIVLMCIGVVYAAFTVYSNEVHVEVGYTLGLSFSLSGSTVTLTAHLESSGNPVGGATVYFYKWGSAWEFIGSSGTGSNGNAVLDYDVSGNGGYDFRAAYDVP